MPVIRYCYNCGSSVTDHGPGTHPHCESCGETTWRNAKPTASVLITDARGRVLLVQRAVEPMLGYWDIPGGFLEPGELPEPGAVREAQEELGVEVALTGLLGMYMDTYRDEAESTLNLVYTAEIVSGTPRADDDALSLAWFGPSELPIEIAFPFMRDALWDWRKGRSRG